MIKAKFINHKGTVIIAWQGTKDFGIGKKTKKHFVCRYSTDNYRTLLDNGVKFVNRFVDAYPFPGHYENPREAQREMLDFLQRHHRCYNLSQVRTGKSAPSAWNIDIRMKYENQSKFLIISPGSVMEDTWKTELFGICTKTPAFYSTHRTQSIKKLKNALKKGRHKIIVMNYEKLRFCYEEIIGWGPDLVILDEFSDLNDHTTQKYEAYAEIVKDPSIAVQALGATPVSNRPTDAWAVARTINPETPRVFSHFKAQTMERKGQYRWESRPEAKDLVAQLLTPSIRFKTEDVADMPDHEGLLIDVDMSKEQSARYQEMYDLLYTESQGQVITAKNAGGQLWKLLQIASGVCKDEMGNPVLIGAEPKMKETKRLIREAAAKTVIMVPFTSVQHYIINELEGMYRVGHINGGTAMRDRKKILDKFQGDEYDILVCHPRTTRYGLKMHAASQMIWFGPVYSALDFEQGCARIRGPGTGSTLYIQLASTPLEHRVFNLLAQRMGDQEDILVESQVIEQAYTSFFNGTIIDN